MLRRWFSYFALISLGAAAAAAAAAVEDKHFH